MWLRFLFTLVIGTLKKTLNHIGMYRRTYSTTASEHGNKIETLSKHSLIFVLIFSHVYYKNMMKG